LGKTLLAKVLAHEIELELERRGKPAGDFVLALGSDIKDRQALDRLIRRAAQRPGSVLFIDEIHTLVSSENMDKWLLLLDEHRWQFLNDRDAEQLADFTIVGATTDYGALPGALRRRFAERQLQPLTAREIEGVLRNRFAVTSAAAVAAAERTHHGGTPWEAIALLTEAEVLTRDRGAAEIEVQDVEAVFRIWDLDSYGLRPHDRAVIRALLTQRREQRGRTKNDAPTILYAASEDATVAMARVDREAYRLDIRPRLMARGFLMTTSKGQTLTERAVAVYQ
jgi:Holliday junction resolvasome RuvABC ATP-dependent DNA helicase subunit